MATKPLAKPQVVRIVAAFVGALESALGNDPRETYRAIFGSPDEEIGDARPLDDDQISAVISGVIGGIVSCHTNPDAIRAELEAVVKDNDIWGRLFDQILNSVRRADGE